MTLSQKNLTVTGVKTKNDYNWYCLSIFAKINFFAFLPHCTERFCKSANNFIVISYIKNYWRKALASYSKENHISALLPCLHFKYYETYHESSHNHGWNFLTWHEAKLALPFLLGNQFLLQISRLNYINIIPRRAV